LVRLAARPGLRAGDAAVGEITRLCGYLPLGIGMLASQLRHHPAREAAELATELAQARDRLALMRAERLAQGSEFRAVRAGLAQRCSPVHDHRGMLMPSGTSSADLG
jgi:hypothetical protein